MAGYPANRNRVSSTSLHKTGNTQHTALLSEEDRTMATVNMYRTFSELQTHGLCDMWADRQTDRHSNASHQPHPNLWRFVLVNLLQTHFHGLRYSSTLKKRWHSEKMYFQQAILTLTINATYNTFITNNIIILSSADSFKFCESSFQTNRSRHNLFQCVTVKTW